MRQTRYRRSPAVVVKPFNKSRYFRHVYEYVYGGLILRARRALTSRTGIEAPPPPAFRASATAPMQTSGRCGGAARRIHILLFANYIGVLYVGTRGLRVWGKMAFAC